jgi:hypothetical protein
MLLLLLLTTITFTPCKEHFTAFRRTYFLQNVEYNYDNI